MNLRYSKPMPVGFIAQDFLKIALQNSTEIELSKNKLLNQQPNLFLKRMINEVANELTKSIVNWQCFKNLSK